MDRKSLRFDDDAWALIKNVQYTFVLLRLNSEKELLPYYVIRGAKCDVDDEIERKRVQYPDAEIIFQAPLSLVNNQFKLCGLVKFCFNYCRLVKGVTEEEMLSKLKSFDG